MQNLFSKFHANSRVVFVIIIKFVKNQLFTVKSCKHGVRLQAGGLPKKKALCQCVLPSELYKHWNDKTR